MTTEQVTALVGPAATLVAALIAGAVSAAIGRGRMARLDFALRVQAQISAVHQASWQAMIYEETELMLRRGTRPPPYWFILVLVGNVVAVTSLAIDRGNFVVVAIGWVCVALGLGVYFHWLSQRKALRKAASKRVEQMEAQVAAADVSLKQSGRRIGALSEMARAHWYFTGAPAEWVYEVEHQINAASDADTTYTVPKPPVHRFGWRVRRLVRRYRPGLKDRRALLVGPIDPPDQTAH